MSFLKIKYFNLTKCSGINHITCIAYLEINLKVNLGNLNSVESAYILKLITKITYSKLSLSCKFTNILIFDWTLLNIFYILRFSSVARRKDYYQLYYVS